MNEERMQTEDDQSKQDLNAQSKFPDWFPNGCPPESAKAIEVEVFRIVRGNPLLDDDFLSHYELGTATTASACARCGVSVFNTFLNARHRQKLSPKLGGYIAKGQIREEHGKTGTPHVRSGHLE